MEKEGLEPLGAHIYTCSKCFGWLVTFMLTNPQWLADQGLPPILRAIPLEEGVVEPCERCNMQKATCYIPCFPPSPPFLRV